LLAALARIVLDFSGGANPLHCRFRSFCHQRNELIHRMDAVNQIEHSGMLTDLNGIPGFLLPENKSLPEARPRYSCSFCGVGDSAVVQQAVEQTNPAKPLIGNGHLEVEQASGYIKYAAQIDKNELLIVALDGQPTFSTTLLLTGKFSIDSVDSKGQQIVAKHAETDSTNGTQTFELVKARVKSTATKLSKATPTPGCLKLKVSMGQQRPAFPIHVQPSRLDHSTGLRVPLSYEQGIEQFADLLLEHRPPTARTLIYACGQIDYFTIFSFQEVFRLLGIRNLAGNAEHCLNAGAVHNEILTGQEGPFLTFEQAVNGPNRFFLLNGWNGLISHPPAFGQVLKYSHAESSSTFDGYLIETVETESALAFVKKCGDDRLLFVRSGTDPLLALAVAHELLTNHSDSINHQFVDAYADRMSFDEFCQTAQSDEYQADAVAGRIAPAAEYVERIVNAIRDIAAKIAAPSSVPINIPSVGLSQTKGAVAHCLWGNTLALVGKYGLNSDGTLAGGTLRIPGQVNAQSEVQGLSRGYFMGRIRFTEEGISEATARMGLPNDAYDTAVNDTARAALDYSDPTDEPELFVCFGTQFESNMLGRKRWIEKLKAANTKLVVVDPIPDPFTVEHADLIIPSPIHAAAAKLYQNGEWRLTLSVPNKQSAPETRTDATIVYDVCAVISKRLRTDESLKKNHPDLAKHSDSGYFQQRFESEENGGALARIDGEVSRPVLWQRIQDYMTGPEDSLGPLYCRPEHADGRTIEWSELLAGDIIYGGVGSTRYRLDYDNKDHVPFRDIFRRPGSFRFFVPTAADVAVVDGIILITGRSSMSNDKKRIRFAVSTFNSGKATSIVDMPDENPVYVSLELADQLGISEGDVVRLTGVESRGTLELPAIPTARVKGNAVYVNFHKTRAEIEKGRYLNDLTDHKGRCPYTAQSNFKLTQITLEPVR
jgi:anaerobic selenocysteine-containing dehydrogenase